MWAQVAAILAPLVGSFLGSRSSSSSSSTNSNPADKATEDELKKLALDRVRTSQPLYASVMNMANARLPKMYQSRSMGAGGSSLGNPSPTQANGETSFQVPDFAQQVVEQYRQRQGDAQDTGASAPMIPNTRYTTLIKMEGFGQTKMVPPGEVAQHLQDGWTVSQNGSR